MNEQYEDVKKQSEKMEIPEAAEVNRIAAMMEKTILKEEENNKLPEAVFKEYFLDFFRNYNKDTEPTDADNTLYAKWIELAGSEYNEVDIIDDKGKVLYSTPPLLTKPTINHEATRDMRINDMAYDATNNFNRTPAETDNFITNKVVRFMTGAVSVDTRQDTERWATILNKYKDPEQEETKEIKKKLDKMPKVIKEDLGLIYD